MSELLPDVSSPAAPPTSGAVCISHVAFWMQHWQELKLHALAHRFYQHQQWTPKEGDWYTITRYGPMLYRVGRMQADRLLMEHHVNDDGQTADSRGQPFAPTLWYLEEFLTGGFAVNRVHVPECYWEVVAQQHNTTLISENRKSLNSR